ncbi:MAG: hydroxymethylbilane synthase [Acidobacteriota bacterium]|nr:hydroxymethylbilane synthase [Acidobacteriota bacterium]
MKLRLGTRRSALALAQSGQFAKLLEGCHPGLEVELVGLTTTGDTTAGSLAKVGGKGLFTEQLEAGLLDGSLDLAVHSLKDLPVELPAGLVIAAHPPRGGPRAAVGRRHAALAGLPEGSRVLTGSLRRRAQLLDRRPDLAIEDIRGNVDTRLRKWRELGAAAVVLAMAGLKRLGLESSEAPASALDPVEIIPAPGQGTLAVEVAESSEAQALCAALDDPATAAASAAERSVVAAFGGDCTLPLAAWARPEDDGWRIRTFVGPRVGGGTGIRAEAHAADPRAAARSAIATLQERGAHDLLRNTGD